MPGTDISGPTAMLRSAATVDNKNGGYVTNMHISKETFRQNPEKIKAMLLTYFAMGGLQLNINCFSRRDLENAMKDPESYRHVIVRVSGYSARFVDLDRVTQEHVLARTVY
jgi:pyruvate-formate lyase